MSYDRRLTVKDEPVVERLLRYAKGLPITEPLAVTKNEVPEIALFVTENSPHHRDIEMVLGEIEHGSLNFFGHPVKVL
jgi:hypothetical protein